MPIIQPPVTREMHERKRARAPFKRVTTPRNLAREARYERDLTGKHRAKARKRPAGGPVDWYYGR